MLIPSTLEQQMPDFNSIVERRRYARAWYSRLTPEQKAEYIEKVKARQRNLPPEKKAEYAAKAKATRAAIPEEAKEAMRAARRAAYAAAKAVLRAEQRPPQPGSRVAKAQARSAETARQRRDRRAQTAETLNRIKAERGCARCGERDPVVLQFHHEDPSAKIKEVPRLARDGALTLMLDEIAKCTVLCANCHAREHRLLSLV